MALNLERRSDPCKARGALRPANGRMTASTRRRPAASQGAAVSSGAAGRATSPSPLRVQIGTPRPDDERSLLEQLVAILQRQSPQREEGGKTSTLRLAKMPICGDHVLPSVKDWQQWYDVKFRS